MESEETARVGRGRFGLRAPLLAKLLVSHVLVLALILAPAFSILRGRARARVRAAVESELVVQAEVLGGRLEQTPPAALPGRIDQLLHSVPVRVTVLGSRGELLGDSDTSADGLGGSDPGRRLQLPEFRQALDQGTGTSIRTTNRGQTMIYAARRFPRTGTATGLVRLAVPASRADRAASDVLSSLDKAGAAALSLALVLSLVAAALLSRPLRRIARGARALAAGDLGHVVDVHSRDELGDVAAALDELAAQLRVRLLQSGADHVILRALLDDLPVGAILYGPDLAPQLLNGAARSLLDMSPASEPEDARRLVEEREQAEVVRRVLESGRSEEQTLVVPGRKEAALHGRWIAVPRADGAAQPALLLWEEDEAERRELVEAAARWRDILCQAAPEVRDPTMAEKLAQVVVEMDRTRAAPLPRPDQVECVALADLCDPPLRTARARAGKGISLMLDLTEPDALVVESGGRVQAALRRLLVDVVGASEPGAVLRLRDEPNRTHVRLSLRLRARELVKTKWLANQVACLGGQAGAVREGADVEVWLSLPRG